MVSDEVEGAGEGYHGRAELGLASTNLLLQSGANTRVHPQVLSGVKLVSALHPPVVEESNQEIREESRNKRSQIKLRKLTCIHLKNLFFRKKLYHFFLKHFS
jgi:hypothetical protein